MMSEHQTMTLEDFISDQAIAEINHNLKKYPSDAKQSAVMRALTLVQEEKGYLTAELMDAVAKYLDMPSIAVYEVATFYSLYEHKPVGENTIYVCRSISCHLRGANQVISDLEQQLNIKCGQTTTDGKFTLKTAECLGACVNAPMMQINKTYHECLTKEKLPEILEQYK
jgi:NADH-quinone oxidoreductase subunit E